MKIGDEGLFFEKTPLIRMSQTTQHGRRLAIDEDADRCLALLSVAFRRPVTADLLGHAEAAFIFWKRGEKAVANFRLLFSGLPLFADATAALRVQLADFCLENGLTPAALLDELGICPKLSSLEKYDPEQPRVPAGSGRASGEWANDVASFLERTTPRILAALTRFGSRFSIPTAVLGALFIPTTNNGGVTSGTLPGAPDISFEKDDPAGRLRLSMTVADGSIINVESQLRDGRYVDIASGEPIGRDLDGQLYLDLDSVRKIMEKTQAQTALGDPEEKPKAGTDEPRLCPAPTPDTPHGASEDAIAYENQVHHRVNPLAPLSEGFGVRVIDPLTGKIVYVEDCFRYAGDLVDGDMNPGDLVEAKGNRKAYLYSRGISIGDDIEQAKKELRAAEARGVGLKWYYSEPGAAAIARKEFNEHGLSKIVIGVMPLRKAA